MLNWLIATTLETSLLIGLVLLIRPPMRRAFGANVAYALWLIPAIVPLLPARATRPAIPLESISLPGAEIPTKIHSAVETLAARGGATWEWLWLVGVGLLLAIQILRVARVDRRVRATAEPFVAPPHLLGVLERFGLPAACVFTTKLKGAPFATGLIRDKVFLPKDFVERFPADEQRWILVHELTHIRRGDVWLRLVAELFRALFWFNPLVHLAVRALRQDQEYACDQTVVGRCTGEERYRYGRALMLGSLPYRSISLVGFFGNGKERYVMLGKHRLSRLSTLLGAMACTLIGVFALTSARVSTAQNSEYELAAVVTLRGDVWMARRLKGEEATLDVRVPDQAGKVQQWTVVLVSANELAEAGLNWTFFAPGPGYSIEGHPSVDPRARRLLAVSVTRPDGAVWSR